MKSYRELRRDHIDYQLRDIFNFSGLDVRAVHKHPYTSVKAWFYLELSAILGYVFIRTSLTPNMVSALSAVAGAAGALLLAMASRTSVLAGCALFFAGSVFDWCDGLVARLTGKGSLTGVVVDPWSTHFFSLAFRLGLAFYVAAHTDARFFYLAPLVVFFLAADLKAHAEEVLFTKLVTGEMVVHAAPRPAAGPGTVRAHASRDVQVFVGRYLGIIRALGTFPDHRARSVDLICAVIAVEQFFPWHLSWIALVLFIVKDLIRFVLHLVFIGRGGWVEGKVARADAP